MQSLLSPQRSGQFSSSLVAQREAALSERELKLRQQEEILRSKAKEVEEQKMKMDEQLDRIQMVGSQINQTALSGPPLSNSKTQKSFRTNQI